MIPIIIAAAGRGTRMKELSENIPKHLIRVTGKPFLYYLLKHIQVANLRPIILVIGHLSEAFEKFVQEYKEEFISLQIVNQYTVVGREKYGSLMPLLAARSLIGEQPFLMVNGDHLYSVRDLSFFTQNNGEYNYVAAIQVDEPSKFGTLVTDIDGFLMRIDEKVPNPVTNLINAGLYRFTPDIWTAAGNVQLSPRGEYEITDAITALAQNKKVKIVPLRDYWLDFGRPEDMALAQNIIANNFK